MLASLRALLAAFMGEGRVAERWQALTAIAWGVWLAWPFATFAAPSGIWSFMGTIAPEWVWGAMTIAIGSAALLASFATVGFRVAANLVMVSGWAFVAWSALWHYPPATVGVLLLMLSIRQAAVLGLAAMDWGVELWMQR